MSRPTVEVWLATSGDHDDPAVDALAPGLAAWERRRLESFHRSSDRIEFAVAHGLARLALSHIEPRLPPWRWRLDHASSGQPLAVGPAGRQPPWVSLSHTRGLVGCALAGCPVGIDLESLGRELDFGALVDQALSPREREQWTAAPEEASAAGFLLRWTAKEAIAKALGLGLDAPLASLEVEVGGEHPPRLLALPAPFGRPEEWRLWRLSPGTTHTGVVAATAGAAAPELALRCHWSSVAEIVARLGEG